MKLLQVAELCDAIDKNGEGIPTPNQWLTCYTIPVQNPNHPGWVFVNRQFGQEAVMALASASHGIENG